MAGNELGSALRRAYCEEQVSYDLSGLPEPRPRGRLRRSITWIATAGAIVVVASIGVVSLGMYAFVANVFHGNPEGDERSFDGVVWRSSERVRAEMIDDVLKRALVCPRTDQADVIAALGQPDRIDRWPNSATLTYDVATTGISEFNITVRGGRVYSIQMPYAGYEWPRGTCWL
jgi:hypothetical protein